MSSSNQGGGNPAGGSGGGTSGVSTNPQLRHKTTVDGSMRDKCGQDAKPPPGSGAGPKLDAHGNNITLAGAFKNLN